MKKFLGMSVFFLLLALMVSCAVAQQEGRARGEGRGPGGGGMGFGGPNMIGGLPTILSEQGRKELGITEEQVTKIREAQRGNMPQGLQDMSREDRTAAMEKATAELVKKVEAIFTKDQLEKVQIASFQCVGIAGIGSSPFAQAVLKLTDEQVKKIRDIQREERQGAAGRQGERPDFRGMSPEERQKAFQETRKKLEEKIRGVLTEEQTKKAEALVKETPAYIKEAQERSVRGGQGNRGERGENQGRQRRSN